MMKPSSRSRRDGLRILGNERQFSTVVISGEVHIAKPDPAVFALAVQKLGLDPQQVWHVGNSLAEDVGGAKSAGVTSVWLNRGIKIRTAQEPVPDYEIHSLRALVDLLQHAD
jgi:putative hydrolase of the HAD superfamily